MILRAQYVIPVSGPPIENGVVEVRETRIVDVRRAGEHVRRSETVDCGDVVLMPGFVNAHTHLELTRLAGKVLPVRDESAAVAFTDWLRRLVAEMRKIGDNSAAITASVQEGAELSLRAGVTTVGDITRWPRITRPALRLGCLRVVSFGEVMALGALSERLKPQLEAACDLSHNSEWLAAGVSPHAPYTCDRRTLCACRDAAANAAMRLCLHLAETREEEICTLRGAGPLVEFLRSVGVWDDSVKPPGLRPVAYAEEVGLLGPRTVLAHVNYVGDADLKRLARTGVHVAYCPRTHAAFRHAPHRFREMRALGINVCVGTDSLASNPSLSVLEELRYLRRAFDDLDAHDLVAMGTLRGARALGMDDRIGSLDPGKQADLVVVPLEPAGTRDPLENVLRSSVAPTHVYVGGRPIQLG